MQRASELLWSDPGRTLRLVVAASLGIIAVALGFEYIGKYDNSPLRPICVSSCNQRAKDNHPSVMQVIARSIRLDYVRYHPRPNRRKTRLKSRGERRGPDFREQDRNHRSQSHPHARLSLHGRRVRRQHPRLTRPLAGILFGRSRRRRRDHSHPFSRSSELPATHEHARIVPNVP